MGLKDLDIRIKLPWKEDPTTARRLYKQIVRADDPESKAREIKKQIRP